jgi:hypothetical protein
MTSLIRVEHNSSEENHNIAMLLCEKHIITMASFQDNWCDLSTIQFQFFKGNSFETPITN